MKESRTKELTKNQKATLYVVLVTAFTTTFTGSALNLSIPDMGRDFQASAGAIGWVVMAYMLTVAALSVPVGRISDLNDRKKLLVAGIVTFAFASLLSAFAWNLEIIIFLRVIQGIGGAMIFSTSTPTLISAFPQNQRGRVLGYSIASTYIGLSAGPVVGGFLNHYLGWRSIFIFTFLLTAAVSGIAIKRLPSPPRGNAQGMDWLGNLLYILMILFLMIGLSAISTASYAPVLIISGFLLLILFLLLQRKSLSPIINVSLFATNLAYTASNLAALLNYGATFAIGYLSSIYLQVVMGYSSQTAGLILIVQPVIMALISPAMGRMSDTVSPHKLSTIGMLLCAAGLSFFLFLSQETSMVFIMTALIISGLGFGIFSSPNTNAVMACVEPKDYGVASSVLATMRSVGHTSSMAVVTLIIGIYMAGVPLVDAPPALLIQTIHASFRVFVVICLIGAFLKPILFGIRAIIRIVKRKMLQSDQ